MINIANKWALITGASRGIGALAAKELAARGCNLMLQSRSLEHFDSIKQILAEYPVDVLFFEAELSDLASVEKMLQAIDKTGHPVDIILNNAGLQIAYRTDYLTTPASDYTHSFLVNTIAPMMICYHFIPLMQKQGFGRIVNTTSGIALDPQQAGYSASKAALDKVTIDVASKLEGSDVIISLTDPGWCRTDLGGPNAPNAPEDALPGVIVGAFVNDGHSGRLFAAGDFKGMTLEEAVARAEADQ